MSAPTLREALENLLYEATNHNLKAFSIAAHAAVENARAALDAEERGAEGGCYDCGRPYPEMHDFIIPLDTWERISPTGDEGGILCANCIVARLDKAGIQGIPGAFMSGPVSTVDAVTMDTLRWAENLRRTVFPGGDLHPALAAPPASEGPPSLYAGATRESEQLREQRHVEASRGPAPAGEPLPLEPPPGYQLISHEKLAASFPAAGEPLPSDGEGALLPCPFCGTAQDADSMGQLDGDDDDGRNTVQVSCSDCGAYSPEGRTLAKARAAWNRRSAAAPPPEPERTEGWWRNESTSEDVAEWLRRTAPPKPEADEPDPIAWAFVQGEDLALYNGHEKRQALADAGPGVVVFPLYDRPYEAPPEPEAGGTEGWVPVWKVTQVRTRDGVRRPWRNFFDSWDVAQAVANPMLGDTVDAGVWRPLPAPPEGG